MCVFEQKPRPKGRGFLFVLPCPDSLKTGNNKHVKPIGIRVTHHEDASPQNGGLKKRNPPPPS
jgi:hypothetical protein